jgi:hypothetical protein
VSRLACRLPTGRTVYVSSNIGIYYAMSALVAVPPQIYREVLALLTSHRRLQVRIANLQAVHEAS